MSRPSPDSAISSASGYVHEVSVSCLSHKLGRMSAANPLWGAPRIHEELLQLGIGIGQATVLK